MHRGLFGPSVARSVRAQSSRCRQVIATFRLRTVMGQCAADVVLRRRWAPCPDHGTAYVVRSLVAEALKRGEA